MSCAGDSPGLSINRFYDSCPAHALKKLLEPEIVNTIAAYDASLMSGDRLPLICKKLIDPKALLGERGTRNLVFGLLPKEKAEELLRRLKVPNSINNPSERFRRIDFEKEKHCLEELYDFFGVQDEERAPTPLELNIEGCKPSYALFSHQRDVISRVEHILDGYPHKTLLHMPTGSGKTRTAMNFVARHLISRNQALVCWLAQSAELLEQAANEFRRAWNYLGDRELPIYRFWGPYTPSLENARDGIIIAGFAKLHAMYRKDSNMLMRLGDRASLTVVDEAHQSIAPSYRSLVKGLHTKRLSNKLLGLSATPGRTWNDISADAELAEFFGSTKVTIEIEGHPDPVAYLMQEGYLARPIFRLIKSDAVTDEVKGVPNVEAEYSDELLGAISIDRQRNRMILAEAESLIERHKRVIVFAASVAHAKMLAAILSAKGHDAEVITGETPSGQRERIIRQFKGNEATPKYLCNYGVLTTGFDAPKTSAALIARPTRSLVLYSQMVGRVIRGTRQGGSATAEIVTVVDPNLPGFGGIAQAFMNWEDVWNSGSKKTGEY